MATEVLDDAFDGEEIEEQQNPADILLGFIESPNIADELDKNVLGELGNKVLREYQIDKTSRADWETQIEEALKLAMQIAEAKTYPWPNASNIKYPLMTTAAIQFAARAYPAIVPASNPVKGKVQGSDKGVPQIGPQGPVMQPGQPGPDGQPGEPQPVWQIEPGAKRKQADRVATHMSWQLMEEMEEWEEDTDKLLHILPIVGLCYRKTWWSKSEGRNVSAFRNAMEVVVNYKAVSLERTPRITEEVPLYPYEITERQRMGVFRDVDLQLPSGDDPDATHEFLEQHRKMDLDEDGYEEPYIVTIHKDSSKVVRIVARFEPEGILMNQEGEIAKIEPVHYYTKYSFLPSPDGSFYDVGFGTLLSPINESINATINQMHDAGTLQNVGGGFINAGLKIKGGALRYKPGEYKMVTVPAGTSMRESVFNLQHPGPSTVLFELLGLMLEAGKDISSVKDVLTGEQGANETATTTLARIEQGLKVFTAIYKRIFRSMKKELKKLAELNAVYLNPDTYFTLLDEEHAIGPKDYDLTGMDIVPVADPASVSDMQKLMRAEFLKEFIGDPMVNGGVARRRIFEAAGIDDIDDLMDVGQPPPPPEVITMMHAADMDVAKLDIEERRLNMEEERMLADLGEVTSRIILNLAKAEAEEVGPQMEFYKAQQSEITKRVTAHAQIEQRRVSDVAKQSGNGNGAKVPQTPGGPPAPGMGTGT